MEMNLFNNDCLDQLKQMADESIDSVVTDPPYGLSFMGKRWDYEIPAVEIWKEVFRVLKPGGHALIACGTRTQHRMAVNIEDAGFEIRDVITWLYGSGFPKSMDISKSIDKQAGAEREVIEERFKNGNMKGKGYKSEQAGQKSECNITAPATNEAKQWQGWGTALKPANEPICLARKPLSEKTVASNVLKHGTGAMNIDECRVEFQSEADKDSAKPQGVATSKQSKDGLAKSAGIESERVGFEVSQNSQGRWPANVILDEEAGKVLDEQSGVLKSGGYPPEGTLKESKNCYGDFGPRGVPAFGASAGGASRFFYCAKASKSERNAGLEGMPEKEMDIGDERPSGTSWERRGRAVSEPRQNFHPTVKPIKLMEYLCKLITPPNGVVLDPFMGSGTTGVAAKNLGFGFVGIEREAEYFEICKRRIG